MSEPNVSASEWLYDLARFIDRKFGGEVGTIGKDYFCSANELRCIADRVACIEEDLTLHKRVVQIVIERTDILGLDILQDAFDCAREETTADEAE